METPITNETLIEQQKRIVAALQLEVAGRIQGGVHYRRELESVGFAIELLDRITNMTSNQEERGLRPHGMASCY